MNIFLHELKAYRKTTTSWTISLAFIVILFMLFYPSFSKEIDSFTSLLEGFPEPIRQALGFELLGGLGELLGFYAYAMTYISLCGAIQAMNLGVSVISKEKREKTADFLLTKPVSRYKVVTAKLLASISLLMMTNIIYVAVASFTASIVKTASYSYKGFFMISISLFFVQLIFLAIGFFLSVILPKIKSVLSVSLGTVFGLFFIGMIAETSEDIVMRYISPFKYFDPNYIMLHSSYEITYLWTGIGIFIVLLFAGFSIYQKKDIHAI